MALKTVIRNPWVQAGATLAALLGLILLMYILSPVLVPLLLAFFVAYILDPVVDWFEARRVPRTLGIFILVALILAGLLLFPLFAVPRIVVESQGLIHAFTKAGEGDWRDRVSDGLDAFVRSAGWVAEDDDVNAIEVVAEKVGQYVRENVAQVAALGRQAGTGIARIMAMLGGGVIGVIVFIANFALFAFVAGYLLKDFDGIVASALDLVPPRYRAKTSSIFSRIDDQLRGFLRGQLIVALSLGVMYLIGFSISGVPLAILVALLGVVASLVPYVGVAITGGVALLLAVMQHGLDWHAAGALATMVFAQALEGNVLTPKIVGDQVGLSPVWVILAVLVFGTYFGFLGMLLAVPVAAALKVLVVEAVEYYKSSSVFADSPRSSPRSRRSRS